MTDSFPKKIDLHMHSTVSDGTDTPEQILERVRQAGLDLFSVTDHDAVKAGRILRKILQADDPQFVCGVEFSCKDENGNYHILGYGFDPEDPAVQRVVQGGHALRMEKVTKRLDFLKQKFGFAFPEEEIRRLLAMDNPGKPHIGNLMVKYGFAKTKESAIRDFINQARFPSAYVRPEEAISGSLKGGGIPVLAHPFYGNGDDLIVGEDMERRLLYLMDFGLQGVEAFYSGFTEKLISQMLEYARRYDLYVTAGSDYHGTNKLITLGDTGMSGTHKMPEGMRSFLIKIGIQGMTH